MVGTAFTQALKSQHGLCFPISMPLLRHIPLPGVPSLFISTSRSSVFKAYLTSI